MNLKKRSSQLYLPLMVVRPSVSSVGSTKLKWSTVEQFELQGMETSVNEKERVWPAGPTTVHSQSVPAS